MEMQAVFKIRRNLFIPLALDACLILVLLLLTIFKEGTPVEITVLSVGSLSLLLITVELPFVRSGFKMPVSRLRKS